MRYAVYLALFLIIFPAASAFADTSDPKCKKCFEKSREYIRSAENSEDDERQKQDFLNAISSFISDAEYYLNNCTDSRKPLSGQTDAIARLRNMISQDCPENKNSVQFIEADKSNNTLILHSVLFCDTPRTYDSGFSVIFFRNTEKKSWSGYVIYPVELIEDKQLSKLPYPGVERLIISQFNPKIYMLDFKDSKGRTYMAVESEFERSDSSDHELSVIRWKGNQPEEVLRLHLNDWCGQPCKWIIEKNGKVIIPAAKAAERCKARKEKIFDLEKDCDKIKCHFDNYKAIR